MLTQPRLDHLRSRKRDGMVDAFSEIETQDGAATLSHAEWLGLLVDLKITSRANKRLPDPHEHGKTAPFRCDARGRGLPRRPASR